MNQADIKIGQRVKVLPHNQLALIVGRPEYYRPSTSLVRIKYENSTRYEHMIDNLLEALPLNEQYPALGGKFTGKKGETK